MKPTKFISIFICVISVLFCCAQKIDIKKFHPETSFMMEKVQYNLGRIMKSAYRKIPYKFYPIYMNTRCKVKDLENIDTLKYCCETDTIISINFYNLKNTDGAIELETDNLIFSNNDNIYVFPSFEYIYPSSAFSRQPNFLSQKFIDRLRRWERDSIIIINSNPSGSCEAKISRIIIEDGQVARLDTLTIHFSKK